MDNNMLICLGAQKAGTTWLAQYLSNHKDVFVSPLKEMHFFNASYPNRFCPNYEKKFKKRLNRRLSRNSSIGNYEVHLAQRVEMHRNLKKYLNYFRYYSVDKALSADITPAYSLVHEKVLKIIKQNLPNHKIIFILRDPLERYWSALRFKIKSSSKFNPLKEYIANLENPKHLERTNYERIITSINNVFDKENVKFLFYENIFDSSKHEAQVKEITEFLCIDYVPTKLGKAINKSGEIELPAAFKTQGFVAFKNTYEFCIKYFGINNLPKAWQVNYQAFS